MTKKTLRNRPARRKPAAAQKQRSKPKTATSGSVQPTAVPPHELPKTDYIAPVREALALLYDAPERLIRAVNLECHEDVMRVVGCVLSALDELRRVYDDRPDRFLDERRLSRETFEALREIAWKTSVRVQPGEVSS